MTLENNFLDQVVLSKKDEVSSFKYRESLADLKSRIRDIQPTRSLKSVLNHEENRFELPNTRIIAEIKKASPSAGVIRKNFDPVQIANDYIEAGASALSVLTDTAYFQGSLEIFQSVRKMSIRPVLRKDFMIEEYQFYQARAYGADATLAIVAILDLSQLTDFYSLSVELGMDCLVEVHNEAELEKVWKANLQSPIIGINNRNLKLLKTDLTITEELIQKIPKNILSVSESGIRSPEEIVRFEKMGISGFLIGESLLKKQDIKKGLLELIHQNPEQL